MAAREACEVLKSMSNHDLKPDGLQDHIPAQILPMTTKADAHLFRPFQTALIFDKNYSSVRS